MQLFELAVRGLCDTAPKQKISTLFLFGQTVDNEASVFRRAKELVDKAEVEHILFLECPAMSGYPGFQHCKSTLSSMGIAPQYLLGIPNQTASLNTLIEAQAMVRYAKSHSITDVYVSAAPFQQVRAFMTAVSVALKEFPQLNVYSQPGLALPWTEIARHSQGQVTGTRSQLIHGEWQRIHTYQRKGDLASCEAILEYLSMRDQRSGEH